MPVCENMTNTMINGTYNGSSATSHWRRMMRNEAHAAKATNACRKCEMFGHWMSDHAPDGSLSPTTPIFATTLDPACIHLPL